MKYDAKTNVVHQSAHVDTYCLLPTVLLKISDFSGKNVGNIIQIKIQNFRLSLSGFTKVS